MLIEKLNPEARKTLEDLLRTLAAMAAAAQGAVKDLAAWLEANPDTKQMLLAMARHHVPASTHKRPTVGERVPVLITTNYEAFSIPGEHDDDLDVN